jgi:hypothetical protein
VNLFVYVRNQRPRYMLTDGVIGLRLSVGATDLTIVGNVEIDYGSHTVSYPMGTAGPYQGRKAVNL